MAAASSFSTSLKPGLKSIKSILPSPPQHWVGDGFQVYPVFHNLAFSQELSPWLMFDYAAPKTFSPTTKRLGVGQHPHRGFETITLAFQGEVEHGDSVGNRGVIGAGDVQWMTAARGIIHEEFHSTNFAKKGGTFEMAQLWLNLPASHKMNPPAYQSILKDDIPIIPLHTSSLEDKNEEECAVIGSIRLIAGSQSGQNGAATTVTPVELFDVSIEKANMPCEIDIPSGHNAVVFVRRGSIQIQGQPVMAQGVALLHVEGSVLQITASENATQLLILGGEPINEPIAARGPFVMNTQEELREAMMDFRNGKLGK